MRIFTLLLILSTGIASAQCPAVSTYSLDATAQDGTGTSHGTITGTPTPAIGHTGTAGSCYYFDGVTDYIHINNDFDFPNRTVSLWFRANNIPVANSASIFATDHPALNNGYVSLAVQEIGSVHTLIMATGSAAQLHNQPINENQWYHVAVVKTTTDTRYYVNCVLVATVPASVVTSANGNPGTMLGCDRLFGRLFDGDIDDVAIYNCGLSATQICSIFTSTSEEHAAEEIFTLYPNPVSAGTNLNLSFENESEYQLNIYNAMGEVVYSQAKSSSSVYIDENIFTKGLYYARLQSPTRVVAVQRFVVE